MLGQTLIFVDGENLALRYKEMLASGRVPRPDNVWVADSFVWNQRVLNFHLWNVKRLSYYTSVVGDDLQVQSVRERIAGTQFTCTTDRALDRKSFRTGQIVPFVRKKSSKSRKESICDIAIAVDVMRACHRDHADTIWIFSGDGDFAPLVNEVLHSGKCAYLSAFSSGLNGELPYMVDEFLTLDEHFFLSVQEVQEATANVAAAEAAVRIGVVSVETDTVTSGNSSPSQDGDGASSRGANDGMPSP